MLALGETGGSASGRYCSVDDFDVVISNYCFTFGMSALCAIFLLHTVDCAGCFFDDNPLGESVFNSGIIIQYRTDIYRGIGSIGVSDPQKAVDDFNFENTTTIVALFTLLSGIALVTLGTLLSGIALIALKALLTSIALRSLLTGITLRSLLTGITLRSLLSGVALITLVALCANERIQPRLQVALVAVFYSKLVCRFSICTVLTVNPGNALLSLFYNGNRCRCSC